MKKIIFILALALVAHIGYAQKGKKPGLAESEIPGAVMDAFKAKYEGVEKSKWTMTKKGNYKVGFKSTSGKAQALFSPDGTWKHTRTKLEATPEEVKTYVATNYGDYETKKVVHHDNGKKGIKYLAHLAKGEEKVRLLFDENKAFVKIVEKKPTNGRRKGKGKLKDAVEDLDEEFDDMEDQ